MASQKIWRFLYEEITFFKSSFSAKHIKNQTVMDKGKAQKIDNVLIEYYLFKGKPNSNISIDIYFNLLPHTDGSVQYHLIFREDQLLSYQQLSNYC